MASNISKTDINSLLSSLNASAPEPEKDRNSIDQDQFLTLLVNQLKNQDPLNPMENDRFAVDLAQFSQLEQLVSINNSLETDTNSVSNLASLLGTKVTLDDGIISFDGGRSSELVSENLGQYSNLELTITNENGAELAKNTVEAIDGTIDLDQFGMPDGDYRFVLTGEVGGERQEIDVQVQGLVSGFIPGADPRLLINDREVAVSDVRRVDI